MAIAVDSSGSSITDGGAFSTTASDVVCIFCYEANTATAQSPSFSNGAGAVTNLSSLIVQVGSQTVYLQMFWVRFTASGSHTATLPNLVGNGQFIAYTGADSVSPIGQSTSGHNTSQLSLTGVTAHSWLVAHWEGQNVNFNLSGTPIVFRTGTAGGQGMGDSNAEVTGDQTQNWSGATLNGSQLISLNAAEKYPTVSDATSLNEDIPLQVVCLPRVQDSSALADDVTISVNNFAFSKADSSAIGEAVSCTVLNAYSLLVTDVCLIVESPTVVANAQSFPVADSTALSETVRMVIANTINTSSSLTMSDVGALSNFTSWNSATADTSLWTNLTKN